MRLKRLELFGFKSFADRTVLDFERSLTGVVGPNGCGKSNVVDAIRWSLGEQRPTSMRGAEMTDVIFKGSTSRPALSVAEVSIVLDNAGAELEERGAEVSITRRVYRSGEGEYLIDGERVRLKDVRDMLFDTGLGSRGYSVLEQGRIDAVLSANPLDRRAIFEEAAGISRYRQRRHEAQNKLKRVERDVDRLDDVIRELQTRSRSLKIQAGKAERYLTARDAWREQATRYGRHRAHELAAGLDEVRGLIGVSEAREEELRALRAAAETDVHERELEQAALLAELDRANARSAELGGELRALDERKAQLSARVGSWRRAADEERAREAALAEKLEERRAELESVEADAAELAEAAREADERLAADRAELANAQRDMGDVSRACEEQNETVLSFLHEKTAAENEVVRLERTIEPLGERLERARNRVAETAEVLAAAREGEEQSRGEMARAEARSSELDRRRADLNEEARGLEERTGRLAERKNEGDLARTRIESRIESLLDHEAERERLDAGARELYRLADEGPAADGSGDHPPVDELIGLLADRLTTTTRFARALDVVLGDRAQALVVRNADAAARIVEWLKRGARGHARFVLPQGIGATAGIDLSEVERLSGVEGPLLRAVDVAPGYESLARSLLASVVVVSDVQRAVELVARFPGLRCVTVDGDHVDAGGVSGGHREVVHGPIGRRASAAELSAEVVAIERAGEELDRELAEVGARRDALEASTRSVLAELESARQELADARGACESARMRCEDLAEALAVHEAECAEIAREQAACEAALAEARVRHGDLVRGFESENAQLEELVRARRRIESGREELARREAATRVESTRLAGRLEAATRRVTDLARGCEELAEDCRRTAELARRHAADAEDGQRQFGEIDGRRGELLSARGEVSARLEDLRRRDREAREAMESLRQKGDAVTRELEAEMERLSDIQLRAQRMELARVELLRRTEEELGLREEDLLEDFQADAELTAEGTLDRLGSEVGDLKRELDRLGSVNLEAVEELEEVSGRLTFLEEQRGDVMRARAALLSTLRTINEESERLFLEAFEEIRENFSRLFRQLFGGGRAAIELAADEPVLEAGIEITARPPGREMLPLGLLSGGQRTMTALALLFAVFQSRPSPFCVLDEVDAALDDANIGRFLVLLDGFRKDTQFVVVTHNKGTMSACDTLYGITMETRGVSRHVSVELSDVDDFVPDVQGDAARAQDARTEIDRESREAGARADDDDEDEEGDAARAAGGNGASRAAEAPDGLDPDTGEPVVELRPEPAGGNGGDRSMEDAAASEAREEALGRTP